VNIKGNASDPDGDPLTYLWEISSRPPNSISALYNINTLDTSLTPDKVGDYELKLFAKDNYEGQGFDSIKIIAQTYCGDNIIQEVGPYHEGASEECDDGNKIETDHCNNICKKLNQNPIVNLIESQTTRNGILVNVNGSASDPDGDLLTYLWEIISAPENSISVLSNNNTLNTSFTPDKAGEYELKLTAKDNYEGQGFDSIKIIAQTYCGDNIIQEVGPYHEGASEECEIGNIRNYCDITYGQYDWYEEKEQKCNNSCAWEVINYIKADCGGYCGDTIINGPEICDKNGLGQICQNSVIGLPTYCNNMSIEGTQTCNNSCDAWNTCVAPPPVLVANNYGSCYSASTYLPNFPCCELIGCQADSCCNGRNSANATLPFGYTQRGILYFSRGNCKLGQSGVNWAVSINHTTAGYKCWE
ncbi:MAG: PKD domain-containing protein, partial [Candidatus Kuenenbacteria bacterium]